MRNNNQSNSIIRWLVIAGDFAVLNALILAFAQWHWRMSTWPEGKVEIFTLVNNLALVLSEARFSTIIHQRLVNAGDILRRIAGLTILQSVLAYLILKVFAYGLPVGRLQWAIGTVFVVTLLLKRRIERWFVKLYREAGRNTRTALLVGSDPELIRVYEKLKGDPTLGYKVPGYYADSEIGEWTHSVNEEVLDGRSGKAGQRDGSEGYAADQKRDKAKGMTELKRLGTMGEFLENIRKPENLVLGDELYLSVSRRDKDIIRQVSSLCDHKVIRFYYVPVSVESIGLNLKNEYLDDMEIYSTYENPLQNPVNKLVKRVFDIVLSLVFLLPTAILFPVIWTVIKIQSPGPLFFKQKRTGLDGKDFEMLKFRSMHVNADADKVQATKDDPRKFPFGNFMRKTNIDELPQFINVFKGEMSIVGPRPHMLKHTEEYSRLINRFMVRHLAKPGITGLAQVTGFRGETKYIDQMEGRVKKDIEYIENWTFLLDIKIIIKTVTNMFGREKGNAY